MTEDLDQLKQFLDAIHPLTDDEWMDLSKHWQPFIAKRKTMLTAAGEREKYLYFVLQGVQRAYYVGPNEREATIVFTYAPSFSGVADAILTGLPSLFYLETLTASRFIRMPAAELHNMMDKHRGIHTLITKALGHTLHGVLKRQAEVQIFTSEEKFKSLMQRSPHLLKLIPHKYIASYLGMDATNFSKLLASVQI
ncbi:MAG TPA: cyclic nucleotide-binding domain-containing protein [Flavobacteriales bacterium]